MRDIGQWQRDLRAAPKVWTTEDRDGNLCNIYESKEAAQLEAEWSKNRARFLHVFVREHNVHTLDLAQRRWTSQALESQP